MTTKAPILVALLTLLASVMGDFHSTYRRLMATDTCLLLFRTSANTGACLVPVPKTFYAASEFCQAHNMTLLEINTIEDLERVYDNTENSFGTGGGTTIWINGRWSQKAKAWYSHPLHTPFYMTEEFSDDFRLTRKFGMCLAVQSYSSKYETVSMRCAADCYFYCGF